MQELAEVALAHVGLDWRAHIRSDPALARGAAELYDLLGNPSKARMVLGWTPTVGFSELMQVLVDHGLDALSGAVGAQAASSA